MPFKDHPDPNKMATKPTPGATEFPYIAMAKQRPAYWYKGGLWSVLADSKDTGNSYCMIECQLPKGYTEAPHIQTGQDEVMYILKGDATFLLGETIESATAGALVFVPRGTLHCFLVTSSEFLCLSLHTPSQFERILPVFGETATERCLPPAGLKEKVVSDAQRSNLWRNLQVVWPAVANPLV